MRRSTISAVTLLAVTVSVLAAATGPATGASHSLVDAVLELPNLRPHSVVPKIDAQGNLAFNTAIENHGAYSFEVLGTPDEAQEKLIAEQCVVWGDEEVHGAPRACERRQSIGTLVWHREHNHLHLDGLATYRLYTDAAGQAGARVRESTKVGYCLTDTFRFRNDPSPVHVHPIGDPLLDDRYDWSKDTSEQWYVECRTLYGSGAPWPGLRMGISPDYEDVYWAETPGQQFPVDGLPDGTYHLQTLVNASDVVTVLETDLTDNEHWMLVCLRTTPGGARDADEGPC